jgi:hypothetical protein
MMDNSITAQLRWDGRPKQMRKFLAFQAAFVSKTYLISQFLGISESGFLADFIACLVEFYMENHFFWNPDGVRHGCSCRRGSRTT